jgi:hypothetical protein
VVGDGVGRNGHTGACTSFRPWNPDDYRDALTALKGAVDGVDVVVGSSFGTSRVAAALGGHWLESDPPVILADPAPPFGTPMFEVVQVREARLFDQIEAVTGEPCREVTCVVDGNPTPRPAEVALALLSAAYDESDLRGALHDLDQPPSSWSTTSLPALIARATFRYGNGELAPGMVGFLSEFCQAYPDADGDGPPMAGAVARTFRDLLGECPPDVVPWSPAPLPPVCLLVNDLDPLLPPDRWWLDVAPNSETVHVEPARMHGAAFVAGPGDRCGIGPPRSG